MSVSRSRLWSFIGYPGDSLPDNYLEILTDELHLSGACSPVHDADLNGDGTEKKAHIHFAIQFQGVKTFEQVKEITDRLHCPVPQQVRDMRALLRYFCHLDNPTKAQYLVSSIVSFGGFDIEDYLKRSCSDNRKLLKEILDFCVENEISDFCVLVEAAFALGNDEWIDIITSRNTMFFSAYLKSKHFKLKEDH